jgi:hypothetical protein
VFGIVELIAGWPWARGVGAVVIALGFLDHARGVWRAWGEADKYEWKTDR